VKAAGGHIIVWTKAAPKRNITIVRDEKGAQGTPS